MLDPPAPEGWCGELVHAAVVPTNAVAPRAAVAVPALWRRSGDPSPRRSANTTDRTAAAQHPDGHSAVMTRARGPCVVPAFRRAMRAASARLDTQPTPPVGGAVVVPGGLVGGVVVGGGVVTGGAVVGGAVAGGDSVTGGGSRRSRRGASGR